MTCPTCSGVKVLLFHLSMKEIVAWVAMAMPCRMDNVGFGGSVMAVIGHCQECIDAHEGIF